MNRLAGIALLMIPLTACASDPDASVAARSTSQERKADFDLLIRGGTVIDGTGSPRRRADVGITADRIAAVGDLSSRTATTILDGSGLIVAPGFIDLLGHSEGSVMIDPRLESKVRQGVTTEVTGEGHSPGPIDDEMAAEAMATRPPGYPDVTWRSLGDFMRTLEKRGTAINFAFYVGATNARELVLGKTNRQPTEDDYRRMEQIIDEAMRDGAVGMSSALIYVPALYASTDELVRLNKVVAKHGGSYFTHMRNEADRIDAAIDEAFEISRRSGAPLNIFHLKIGGRHNWGRMPAIVKKIEDARASGLNVASNVYPYTATATSLTALAPDWALEGGYAAFLARLRDPEQRKRIAAEIRDSSFYKRIGGATGVLVRRIPSDALKQFERKRLNVIAEEMKQSRPDVSDAVDAALVLYEQSITSPTAIYFSMSEDDVKVALVQPWVAVGSDSGAVVGAAIKEGAHPRAYGTFPRILGLYVRDQKLMTLEEAIRKMTSLAAERAHLPSRGVIREGMKADVVVFDAATIRDLSTYEDPHHFSEGIVHVVVNGTPVLQSGEMTGKLPGRVLRRGVS